MKFYKNIDERMYARDQNNWDRYGKDYCNICREAVEVAYLNEDHICEQCEKELWDMKEEEDAIKDL